jgi:hypothetical protein
MSSTGARENIKARLERLGLNDEESSRQWQQWFSDGIDALADYLMEQYPEAAEWPTIQKLRKLAFHHYLGDLDREPDEYRRFGALPINMADLRQAVQEAEDLTAGQARQQLATLREEHKTLTKNWARATDAMQQVLKEDLERIEGEMATLSSQTVPLRERFAALYKAEEERQAEQEKLMKEWPALEGRERGEALRRLFKRVTLFWDTVPPKAGRCRPRHLLRPDRIGWALETSELDTSSRRTRPLPARGRRRGPGRRRGGRRRRGSSEAWQSSAGAGGGGPGATRGSRQCITPRAPLSPLFSRPCGARTDLAREGRPGENGSGRAEKSR